METKKEIKNAKQICSEAAELVGGNRAHQHGNKVETHQKIARLWSAYLSNLGTFPEVNAVDVCNLMELLKIARRLGGAFNLDDYVDGAGYSGIGGEIAQILEAKENG